MLLKQLYNAQIPVLNLNCLNGVSKDAKTFRGFLQSLLWEYPVHAFIGIVKGQPSVGSAVTSLRIIIILVKINNNYEAS